MQFIPPTDHEYTSDNEGNDDTVDSDGNTSNGRSAIFSIEGGATVLTDIDCGLWSPGTVESYVWEDTNEDGIQDSNEVGLEGVTVELQFSNGTFISSGVSDVNGLVTITGVPADGNMKLKVITPSGYRNTTRDAGSDDTVDSDVGIGTGLSALFSASMGNQTYMDIDCLLYTSPSPRDATLSRMPSSA